MSVNEDVNKKWLKLVQTWTEKLKSNPDALFFEENDKSVFSEYQTYVDELRHYVNLLDAWIAANGIKKASQEIPTVGKLFSQLCKIPLVHVNEQLSTKLISCMLSLSDLTNPDVEESEKNTFQRAKKWTVDHFLNATNMYVGGVDTFLMEEFGISQEEYLIEHVKQVVVEITKWLEQPHLNDVLLKYNQLMFDVFKLIQEDSLLPVLEEGLSFSYRNQLDCSISSQYFAWLLSSKHIKKLSFHSLHALFSLDYQIFESYIIDNTKEVIDSYPYTNRRYIKNMLTKSRIIDLCCADAKYFHGLTQILKETFHVVGQHPSLICFVQKAVQICSKQVRCADDVALFNNMGKGLSSEKNEQKLLRLHSTLEDELNREADVSKEIQKFNIWFNIIQQTDCINQALLFLFDGKREQTLTSYVFALRNLQQKKHLQLCDLKYLLSSVVQKLQVNISTLLYIINVLFFAKSGGGGSIMKEFLDTMFHHMHKDDIMYWFLYTLDFIRKALWDITETNACILLKLLRHFEPKIDIISEDQSSKDFHVQRCKELLDHLTKM
ncbi:uncharacterized protein LOC130630586 isoform X2 [Hydractinia symbiolongicarpus]|uniref:uncharacterized protein LOC130630586 isoform X2 n=1 Tax=Hydractinia symbiolongicarpus TaxID=13093 RepID=UPI0025514A01|nr:uncharacterized protein LOC130630586 isoform X2 [Hydractinia symbiolongicarpus]